MASIEHRRLIMALAYRLAVEVLAGWPVEVLAAACDSERARLLGVYEGLEREAAARKAATQMAGKTPEGKPIQRQASVSQKIDSPKDAPEPTPTNPPEQQPDPDPSRNQAKTDHHRAKAAGQPDITHGEQT